MFKLRNFFEQALRTAANLTFGGRILGLFTGIIGGKRRQNRPAGVGNFSVVLSASPSIGSAWVLWGNSARFCIGPDVALRSGIHNPHALLTLLPNISLSIYKGLP